MTDTAFARPRFAADISLALINRTGAYHVCRDLVAALPEWFTSQFYWRFRLSREPGTLLRRGLGKAMLFELNHPNLTGWLPAWNRRTTGGSRTVYFDPLYVLRATLDKRDIVLCHDVGPVTHAELYPQEVCGLYAKAYDAVSRVRPSLVFVSEASRAAFTGVFGSDFPRLEVIPLYVRAGASVGSECRPKGVKPPFLLTVAALERRKNLRRAIEAFGESGLWKDGVTYELCGPRGNDAAAIADLASRTPGVTLRGFLPDEEIRWLYRHGGGFVLPSLLEGFGLPALEAAQHGLLSIVGREGALPEAIGGNAVLVDPCCADDIARGMRELIDLPSQRKAALVARARQFADQFSFDRYVERWSHLLSQA